MPTIIPLTLLAISTFLVGEENTVTFSNGDRLSGTPLSLKQDKLLHWQSASFVEGDIRIHTESIDSIVLSNSSPTQSESDGAATRLQFYPHYDRSHDTLHGNLTSLAEESIVLDTWYAGPLTLKRSMLKAIEVSRNHPAIYAGPGALSTWTILGPQDSWTQKREKLFSKSEGSIAKEFPGLPKTYVLSFILEFPFPPSFQTIFSANSGNTTTPSNGYTLFFSPHSVRLSRRFENASSNLNTIEPPQLPFLEELEEVHIDLYIDQENGQFTLYFNEAEVCQWQDDTPIPVDKWLHFSSKRQSQQTLSRLFLRSWDGQLPRSSQDNERASLGTDLPLIELQNGDTIAGTPQNIENGSLVIETEFTPLSVPIERLRSLEVTPYENREEPRMWKGDVRAFFHEGGHVTLRLSEITSETITGYSQIFGDATFKLAAFSRVEFNPYKKEFRLLRGQRF